MITSEPPVLVLGGGGGNGLGIARNLGCRGIPVYCVTSDPYELACGSRYCTGAAIIPSIESEPQLLAHQLIRFARSVDTPCVLFPTTDTALLTVSQIRCHLDNYAYVIPDHDTVETMVVKSKFYPSLRGSGIPHPQTLDPIHVPVNVIEQTLTFPVFLRPVQTLVYLQHFRGKGFVARTPREMRQYLHVAHQKHVEMLVQEIIPGPTVNGYIVKGYFTRHGSLPILFASQKVLQSQMFANSAINTTIPLTQLTEVIEPFVKYLRQRAYRGLFSAEWKRDSRDGRLKLLEVNARSTGDSYYGRACGADDVYAAYCDALGRKVVGHKTYTYDLAYINEFTSLRSLFNQVKHLQISGIDLLWFVRQRYLRTIDREDFQPVLIEVKRYLDQIRQR